MALPGQFPIRLNIFTTSLIFKNKKPPALKGQEASFCGATLFSLLDNIDSTISLRYNPSCER